MAKKKKKFNETLVDEKHKYDNRPELHGVISKNNYDFIGTIRNSTVNILEDTWVENLITNKKYWKKHAPLNSCVGLCKNKAVIGIGAGISFNKNKNVLRDFINRDGVKSWEDRDFVTIASNHQYKPLLEMGIIPDFVFLVDASNVVLDQLTKDIPASGQNTTLITGLHADPEVIETWTKQGRGILFYMTPAPKVMEAFRKHIKKNPYHHKVELGGNVINGAWMTSLAIFNSTVFMCVGNDLSFPISDRLGVQRELYYADGDYSTNARITGTGRDEAGSVKRWGGFELEKRLVFLPGESPKGIKRYNVNLDVVGTSHTLWVYKTWLETTMMGQTQNKTRFNYFNCTEGGIVGVMARKDDDESLRKPENWYMLDEVCINKHTGEGMYHTAILEDAMKFFIDTKENMKWQGIQPLSDAQYARGSEAVD